MGKVAVIKDYVEFAIMLGSLLESEGHQVLTASPPVDWDAVLDFGPDLTVIGFFRQRRAHDRPIEDFEKDVFGTETLRAIEAYPAIRVKPLLAIGNGVEADELPEDFRVDDFVYFPDEMCRFLEKVDTLAHSKKGNLRLSEYGCLVCGGRLSYPKSSKHELFCLRCHTAISLIDAERCIYQARSEGETLTCRLEQLRRPTPGDA